MSKRRPRVVAIIQARTGSSRFPSKVLQKIGGKTMLARVIERTAAAKTVDAVVVAVPRKAADRKLETVARAGGAGFFMGSERDVLDRFYRAAKAAKADVIVRTTSDCPMVDPAVIDAVVRRYLKGGLDYVSNVQPPTFPDGLDVEVFGFKALARSWKQAAGATAREHVTVHLRDAAGFKRANVVNREDLSHERWTVDTPEDLSFVRSLFGRIKQNGKAFSFNKVVELLKKSASTAAPGKTSAQRGIIEID